MTGWPHLVHGTVSKPGKSPGIQLLALQAPQMARRNVAWLESFDTLVT